MHLQKEITFLAYEWLTLEPLVLHLLMPKLSQVKISKELLLTKHSITGKWADLYVHSQSNALVLFCYLFPQ